MWFQRNGSRIATAIKTWFFSLSKKKQIAIFVILTHVFIILAIRIDHWIAHVPPPIKPIIVKDFRSVSPSIRSNISAALTPHVKKPPAPIKKTSPPCSSPQKKPLAKKPRVALSTPSKKQPPSQKPEIALPPPSQKQPLSQKPEIALPPPSQKQPLSQKPEIALPPPSQKQPFSQKPEIALPSPIQLQSTQPTQIENMESFVAPEYAHILIDCLESNLQFPELGQVRVQLKLKNPGMIDSFDILSSQSDKNAKYLREQLMNLELPSFLDFGIVDSSLDFTIVFRNVEKNI